METLYHQTTQLIQETTNLFHKLENSPDWEGIENAIQSKINAISANCERLDVLVFKVPINERPMAKMRVDQLKYDNKHIQASLNNAASKRRRREQEKIEREQLLSRRFGHDHTEITVDYLGQEQSSLQNSHRNVDEMLHTGSNILQTLRYNRDTLKGAHKRLIDLANTLGLSNATISLIERRVSQDKYVLFGGMLVTLTVIVLVIIYIV
ncbi:probable Golgi SNAP receptor complex member 2 [Bicyclus anynana]|uniref:Probable Golgi SNAP receptor complex member 2 n=1 Tax=Bicyclus anynana TaxID=110368 RepID=A0A6J1NZS3_BICAN|nr:probable Golgi SNAP receptor complex member 2 [Bicyclus anynana]